MIDSSNKLEVVRTKDGQIVIRLLAGASWARPTLNLEDAINLAAWIQVLADPEGKASARLISEIKKGATMTSEEHNTFPRGRYAI